MRQSTGNIFSNQYLLKLFKLKAVLVGDFILAKASNALARLNNSRVVELLSQVLEDLVDGEFLQIEDTGDAGSKRLSVGERVQKYFQRIYLKTGSLFANSCMACAILADSSSSMINAVYGFGRNIGIAFQLADDLLDYDGKSDVFGKRVGADLKQKLWTAPTLLALKECPKMTDYFLSNGEDVFDIVRETLSKTKAVSKTKDLCRAYSEQAVECLNFAFGDLERSDETKFLHNVCDFVINRHL
ncbi:hypothetical protein ACOME3_006761 [Neoechinorhynchus agilis]